MRYSHVLGKSQKQQSSELEVRSHILLTKAGFIDKPLAAGVYTLLPLGWRVHQKIADIIREELNKLGAQEMLMPSMQPKALWEESKRWQTFEPPLFKFQDQFKRQYCLAPTHEEVMSDIARRFIQSYKDLPFSVYQIQAKFRNEKRARGGVLRGREFCMQDLYSFHSEQKDLNDFYQRVRQAYVNIFQRCGLDVKIVEASSGSIGGSVSHEFMLPAQAGEDKIAYCPDCGWAANFEVLEDKNKFQGLCPHCASKAIKQARAIELGHIFQLGDFYSQKMDVYFTNKQGKQELVLMGCYGIGLERLMAAVVEAHNDEKGIIWPQETAPFRVHLLGLQMADSKVREQAEEAFNQLISKGIETLFDDRQDISVGEKLKDADLIGCPYRLIVSEKTMAQGKVELKQRGKQKASLLNIKKVVKILGQLCK